MNENEGQEESEGDDASEEDIDEEEEEESEEVRSTNYISISRKPRTVESCKQSLKKKKEMQFIMKE